MAFFSDPLTFKIAGLAGVLAVLLGSLVAGIFYRGKDGERYSPLNHFISELGEEGVSAKAGWFNLSLIVSGLCLLAACISLGLILLGSLPALPALSARYARSAWRWWGSSRSTSTSSMLLPPWLSSAPAWRC